MSLQSAIIRAGLLTGTLDIVSACLVFSIRTSQNPLSILNYVASGLLGSDALTGGWPMALLGLLIHFMIAFCWSIIFFFVFPKLPKSNWILYGLIYGIIVWLMMNLIMLPMTNVEPRPFSWSSAIIGAVILMLMIGLPNAFLAIRHYKK